MKTSHFVFRVANISRGSILFASMALAVAVGTVGAPAALAQNTLSLNARPDYAPLNNGRQLSFDLSARIPNLDIQELNWFLSPSTLVVNLPAGVSFTSATVPASVSGSPATGQQVTLNMGTVKPFQSFQGLLSVSTGTVADGATLQAAFDLSGSLFITSQIEGAVRDATGVTVTITNNGVNGLVPGEIVTVAGATDPTFNGTFLVATVPDIHHFSYAQAGTPNATAGFGGTATVPLGPIDSGAVNVSFQAGYLPVVVFVNNYDSNGNGKVEFGTSFSFLNEVGAGVAGSATCLTSTGGGIAPVQVGATLFTAGLCGKVAAANDPMLPTLPAPVTPVELGEITGPGAELILHLGTRVSASGGFLVTGDLSSAIGVDADPSTSVSSPTLTASNPNPYPVTLQADVRSDAYAVASNAAARDAISGAPFGFPGSAAAFGALGFEASASSGVEDETVSQRLLLSPSGSTLHTLDIRSCYPEAAGPTCDFAMDTTNPVSSGGIVVPANATSAAVSVSSSGLEASASANSKIAFDAVTGLTSVIRTGSGNASAAESIRISRADANIGVLEATTPSKLQITGHSPITLQVTDSQGRRIGFNPAATPPPLPGTPPPTVDEQPTILTEIPGASYVGINSDPQTISIPDPVLGDYTVLATGTGTGPFTVTMQTLNVNGVVLGSQDSIGAASPGSSNTIGLTIQNDGSVTLKTPTCAADLSSSVSVVHSGFGYNFFTRRFVQGVTLTNTSGSPISGPVSLVLDSLSSNATLFNASGTTVCAAPLGSPFITVGDSSSSLAAGQNVTIYLQFTDPTKAGITYNTRVLAGSGTP